VTEQERYDRVDLPFYRGEVEPLLPRVVLDFHAHLWSRSHWRQPSAAGTDGPRLEDGPGSRYMVVDSEYPLERLAADARRILPQNEYRAVCFGMPTPQADVEKTNRYLAEAAASGWVSSLMLAGKGLASREELERALASRAYKGYKVFLNWLGDDYGERAIEDMIGPVEMELAERKRLVVLLHVPRAGRLADPVVQEGVRALALGYPDAQIVLAHCGRCYLPDEMKRAVGCLKGLDNVWLDTAMVMDPTVLQIVMEELGPGRLLFATDLPVAAMRGRRVYVLDHWVDLVLPGPAPSAYRVPSPDIRASFMVYEIILAIRRAAQRAKIPDSGLQAIFHDNGQGLLARVRV
jgi:predicted TIM-barrel fold metal-dependent hydrolase